MASDLRGWQASVMAALAQRAAEARTPQWEQWAQPLASLASEASQAPAWVQGSEVEEQPPEPWSQLGVAEGEDVEAVDEQPELHPGPSRLCHRSGEEADQALQAASSQAWLRVGP